MFEPENDIERMLMRASAEPSERAGFARALMDAAIGRALVGDILQGRMLDAVPLGGSPLSSNLRTGIPVTAAKRGFIQKLFR